MRFMQGAARKSDGRVMLACLGFTHCLLQGPRLGLRVMLASLEPECLICVATSSSVWPHPINIYLERLWEPGKLKLWGCQRVKFKRLDCDAIMPGFELPPCHSLTVVS